MYDKAFREVYEILDYMSEEHTSKISKNFITYVLENADWDYDFKYDENKKLEEHKLLVETEIILSMIYFKYFLTETEKTELLRIMKQNDIESEKAKIEKFKNIDIFANNKKENKTEIQLPMVVNEKWYKKILLKFKEWFNKNKGE